MSMPHTCQCRICQRDMADFTALNTVNALSAELTEAKLQRDSWKRIAESGLGITAETTGERICTCDGIDQAPCPKHSPSDRGTK